MWKQQTTSSGEKKCHRTSMVWKRPCEHLLALPVKHNTWQKTASLANGLLRSHSSDPCQRWVSMSELADSSNIYIYSTQSAFRSLSQHILVVYASSCHW